MIILFHKKTYLAAILLLIAVLGNLTSLCYANSAEPPSILIMVPNAPEDLELIVKNTEYKQAYRKDDRIAETLFIFYTGAYSYEHSDVLTLMVKSSQTTFETTFKLPRAYKNVYTLDLENRVLIPGKLLSRSIFLILIRVLLTLIIEGLIFYLFGYRKKESWIAFLKINLFTQAALNIWLHALYPSSNHLMVSLSLAELFVVIIEACALYQDINEHKDNIIVYVITANFVSYLLGAFIIMNLPV